jgi:hypothetical protein
MKSIELLTGLNTIVAEMITSTEARFLSLPDHVLNKKANPATWSILECIEHLNRYLRYYNPAIAKRLVTVDGVVDVEVKSTWIGRKSIAAMHPSNRKSQKTLKHMNPANSSLDASVITEFLAHQNDLLLLIGKARRADMNKIRIPIEFFRLAALTLAEALQFVVVHQQRHFIQLETLMKAADQSRTASLVV